MTNIQPQSQLRTPQVFQPPSSPSTSSISSESSCGYSSGSSSPSTSPLPRTLPLRLPKAKYKQLFSSVDRWYPSPKQRLNANNNCIQSLQAQIKRKVQDSYFFKAGQQEEDERFQKVFIDFFRELRGGDPLSIEASILLADRFRGYSDVSEKIKYSIDAGDFSDIKITEYRPTEEVILELKKILEEEYGLKGQFIGALNKAGQKIADYSKLEDRDLFLATLSDDHPYRQKWTLQTFPIYLPLSNVAKLFPKCIETLKDIFNKLLISEWLKQDIDGVKLYLKETDYVDRPIPTFETLKDAIALWTAAKHYGEQQKLRDVQLSKKHRNELKDDLCGIVTSGGLSFVTGNPTFVIGQAAKTAMNSLGNKIDPEGKDKSIQILKLFGGVGLGGAIGGNTWDLGTALGVDLLDLATKAEKTGKTENALRNLGGSVLKGILTQDKKKLVCQILGANVSEAVNQLPETDETTPLDIRIAMALISNSDIQGHYIKQYVDNKFKAEPKPKVGGELTPEEQEKYPKQEPTLADLEHQAAYDKWQEDSKQHTLALTAAQNELIQKEAGVTNANKYLQEKLTKYDKAILGRDNLWEKVEKAQRNHNNAVKEKNTALNTVLDLQGQPIIVYPKEPKTPKPKTVAGKVWNWTKNNVAVSGEMSATKAPLYTTKPSTVSDRYIPREAPPSTNRPQAREPIANRGQWENVQAMQRDQLLNENMRYQSSVIDNSLQAPLDYQAFWGQGASNNVQVPPMDLSSLGRSNPVDIRPAHNRPLQMAGFVPFVVSKMIPEQTQRNVETWVKGYVQQWKENPLKAKRDADICLLLGAKKTIVFAIQAFEQPSLKTRPNSFGLMEVSDKLDNWVAKKVNIDLGSPNAQMGMFVGEIAMPLPLLGGCKPCMKVGQEAFAFMRQSARYIKPQPLLDRALLNPQGFGKHVRAIEALQNPAYHSGIGSPWSEIFPIYSKKFYKKSVTQIEYKALEAAKGVNRSNNYQFITWTERGETKAISIGNMSHSGTFHDRGGLTKAGRALQKHSERINPTFPQPTGNVHEINMQGQKMLDRILDHPNKEIYLSKLRTQNNLPVIDIFIPGKNGARFTKDGKEMVGFLEPLKEM